MAPNPAVNSDAPFRASFLSLATGAPVTSFRYAYTTPIMRTLTVPPAAQRDDDSVQMLSAWIAEKGLHCSLKIGTFKSNGKTEDRAWGILLADVIRHLGNAIRDEHGVDPDKTIENVVSSLLAELEQPTSFVDGNFHPGHS